MMGSASIAQVIKSLVSGSKIPRNLRLRQLGSEGWFASRKVRKLGKAALKVCKCTRCPPFQLGSAGSEAVCGNDDRYDRGLVDSKDLGEGPVYGDLVLLELIVRKERTLRITRTLLCRDPDGIRLPAHRSGLTAKPALLHIVAIKEYLVRIRADMFAGDEPHSLN